MIRACLSFIVLFTLLLGGIYPGITAALLQLIFPTQANGSLLTKEDKVIGSELIGQSFTSSRYFWGRPSAVETDKNAMSGGSNLNPANFRLIARVQERIGIVQKDQARLPIPVDLVTASASGLDPHISIEAARYQIARIAKARKMKENELFELIETTKEGRQLGVFGEPTVNVLKLNIALDKITPNANIRR